MSKKTSPKANQRGAARLAAIQALYQMDIGSVSMERALEQFSFFRLDSELGGIDYLPVDRDYLCQILKGVKTHQVKIDPVIDDCLAKGWPITRIDVTLRAILRSAAFELLFKIDVPTQVIINEYVDVARAFYSGEQPAMVNAVLDTISKNYRACDRVKHVNP